MAIGNYYFVTENDEEVVAKYTIGYRLRDNQLEIVLHHSPQLYSM